MKGTIHIAIGALGLLILFLIAYVVISQVSPGTGDSIAHDVGELAKSLGNVVKP